MLKTRIIPTLLYRDNGLVKGKAFDSWRRVGTALPAIKVYNVRDVDEIVFLDITATTQDRRPDFETVSDLASECFAPLTVGGGIRSVEDVQGLLLAGADKVVLNTIALEKPVFVAEAAHWFGSQCIVVSVDVKRTDDSYAVWSHSGTTPTKRAPEDWARTMEDQGAGEILLTSIDRDGTMAGYDTDMIRSVSEVVSIPVIASGGAGSYVHLYECLVHGGASAVAAASIFHFTELTPLGAKQYLADQDIPVRIPGRSHSHAKNDFPRSQKVA
ncbi:MAG: imidazole glycerol phosphate synthase cyclase subunit [Candidatus Latescibacterota bacterium]|nr:imidazole glycerol phosphate synthase cyclase subunit [Candidatus Latescibacterota bacterium]